MGKGNGAHENDMYCVWYLELAFPSIGSCCRSTEFVCLCFSPPLTLPFLYKFGLKITGGPHGIYGTNFFSLTVRTALTFGGTD